MDLTAEEFDELVLRVIDALRNNSRTIPELDEVNRLKGADRFEISGGRNISYSFLKEQLYSIFGGMTDAELVEIFKLLKNHAFLYRTKDDTAQGVITFIAGFLVGDYLKDQKGACITPEGYAELADLLVRNDSVFKGSLASPDFVSGFIGGYGWALTKTLVRNSAGIEEAKYTLEIDNLIVRNTLRIYEMIVSQLVGENDNRIFTAMLEVDHYDPETGRIWLDTQNGKFYNPFRKGDYIMVQQYNGMPSEENNYYVTKHYEFIVTETGIGDLSEGENRLDWLTFEAFTSPMEGMTAAELISKGDSITRVDSLTDEERKGIIQIITVGSKTPYLDVIYGLKTDPDNYLKARLGNLQGIRHHLFGWLRGFGLYTQNGYFVGDFRVARTGESLDAQIEMLKDRFSSQYSEIEYDITEEDNLLFNPTFTENMDGWEKTRTDTASVIIDEYGDAFMMNGNLFLGDGSEAHTVSLDDCEGRKMLHIWNNGIRQRNELIKDKMAELGKTLTHTEYTEGATEGNLWDREEKGKVVAKEDAKLEDGSKEVYNKLYLFIKYKAVTSGTLTIGFRGAGNIADTLPRPAQITLQGGPEWQTTEWEGTWDGKGDFVLEYTGEIYVSILSLTDDPVEDFKNEYGTQILQTARNINLLAYNTNKSVASLTITANEIRSEVFDVDSGLNTRISQTAQKIELLAENFSQFKDATENDIQDIRENVRDLVTDIGKAGEGGILDDIYRLKGRLDDFYDGGTLEAAWASREVSIKEIRDSVNNILYYDSDEGRRLELWSTILNLKEDYAEISANYVSSDNLTTLIKSAGFRTTTENAELFASRTEFDALGKEVQESMSKIEARFDGFELSYVKQGETIADINASDDGLKIKATHIKLEGYTTINEGFSIDENGNATMNDAIIKGELVANTFAYKETTSRPGQVIDGSFISNESATIGMILPPLEKGQIKQIRVMLPTLTRTAPQNECFIMANNSETDSIYLYNEAEGYERAYFYTESNLFFDLIGVGSADLFGKYRWYIVPVILNESFNQYLRMSNI